ncbi:hypothetical protein CN97_15665 [Haematobacter massiliensis]|uniref:Uncharacterized protein n=1 Tax=Haematobacter massiliensis TaxID=195105 RepID=A0A086Y5U0_9RHOB|nr:hypothetical protein CN97_15665 [Haematobacter massiliensis]OWJ88307.1 hypothetical protein CDV51_02525 [Haematobacter massiliensis]
MLIGYERSVHREVERHLETGAAANQQVRSIASALPLFFLRSNLTELRLSLTARADLYCG